eukprot:Gregarina_sp_Poly_1__3689@NODE_208_length_11377_cov_32_000884_g185_i0_p2_GENE_NODE_208_length_11377_cov_32_000884_g185_i0NODE_208_length_11377_cov_32_000884_g185_i0_p2_ORF_typecomplete_len863_score87_08Glyco_hydro_47/PF01532_20/8_1e58Glyco_hydro_47/PF01532_20/48_NODE_208_length_11377_cov_32_000884_g185_i0878711093
MTQQNAHWLFRICRDNTPEWVAGRSLLLLTHAHTFGEYLAEEVEQRRRWIERLGKFVWDNYEVFSLGAPEIDPRTHEQSEGEWGIFPMFVYDNIDALWMFNWKHSAVNVLRWMEIATVVDELVTPEVPYLRFRATYFKHLISDAGPPPYDCAVNSTILRLRDNYVNMKTIEPSTISILSRWLDHCLKPFTFEHTQHPWQAGPDKENNFASTPTLLTILKTNTSAFPTFNHDDELPISFFEMTIRGLGGLLSGFILTAHPVVLYRAWDLGHRLSHDMFWCMGHSSPCLYDVLKHEICIPARTTHLAAWSKNASPPASFITTAAVIGSNQLEYRTLSELTGVCEYSWTSDRMLHAVLAHTRVNYTGLMPIYMSASHNSSLHVVELDYQLQFGIGAEIDSMYEYLVKSAKQMLGTDRVRNQSVTSFASVFSTFLGSTDVSVSKPIRELPHSLAIPPDQDHWIDNGSLKLNKLISLRKFSISSTGNSTVMNSISDHTHLGCFVGGLLILLVESADISDVLRRKLVFNAENIAEGCAILYLTSPLGLPPEHMSFTAKNPHAREASLLRPEIMETLSYLWHHTHKIKYRNLGWHYFTALMTNARTKFGLCSVADVGGVKPTYLNCRQDTWILAETLKYLLTLFSSKALIYSGALRPAFDLDAVREAARAATADLFAFRNFDRNQTKCPAPTLENMSSHLCPINVSSQLKFQQVAASKAPIPYDIPFVPRHESTLFDAYAYKETIGEGIDHAGFTSGFVLTTEAHPVPVIRDASC